MPDEPVRMLRVTRTSDRDIKVRELYVRIDDGKERTLKFGDSFETSLSPGPHTILVTNRLNKRRAEFDGATDASFEVANVVNGCMSLLLAFGIYTVDLRRLDG